MSEEPECVPHWQRRIADVYCDEPLSRQKRYGSAIRGGVAQPGSLYQPRARLRSFSHAKRAADGHLQPLCVTYDLGKPGYVRGVDTFGKLSRGAQRSWRENALYRRPPVRGL